MYHYGPQAPQFHPPHPSHAPSFHSFPPFDPYLFDLEQTSVSLLRAWNLDLLIPAFAEANLLSYEEFPHISVRFLQSLRIPDPLANEFMMRVEEMMIMFQCLNKHFRLPKLLRTFLQQGIWHLDQFLDVKKSDFDAWGVSPEFTELFFFKVKEEQFRAKVGLDGENTRKNSEDNEESVMKKAKQRDVKDLMGFLNTARKGVVLLKYPTREGMFASKGERQFSIQTLQKRPLGDAILSWHKVGRNAKRQPSTSRDVKMVKIADIRAIRPGLSKQFPKANYKHCLHIQTHDRVLNLEAKTQDQQSLWLRSLQLLLKYKDERVQYKRKHTLGRRKKKKVDYSSSEEDSDADTVDYSSVSS